MFNLWLNIYRYVPYAVIRLLSSSQKSDRFLAIIIYLKKCVLIHISMSIIEKVFILFQKIHQLFIN